MHRILIVDDNPDILTGLEINLTQEGYEVLKACRGDTGLQTAIQQNPSLIVLDVMLPAMSGLDVCRELRRRGIEVPIILLTARAEEVDKVVGFEIGADDYVTKPFGIRELLARIAARLRRPAGVNSGMHQYRFDSVELDFDRQRATRDGKPVGMTSREFEILRILIQSRGAVVTRERLLNEVCGYDAYCTTRTVDTHVLRLRRKLEDNPATPAHILSVYGAGYKFVD